jgi:hypothetical protein
MTYALTHYYTDRFVLVLSKGNIKTRLVLGQALYILNSYPS